jgi:hypothetical protein
LELGKGPHYQGRADHACHTSPCAGLERAGDDGTLGMGSMRWRGVVQFGDEYSGVFIAIFHASADILGGTDDFVILDTHGNEPVCSQMFRMRAVC